MGAAQLTAHRIMLNLAQMLRVTGIDHPVRDFNVRWWGFWRYDQSRVIAGPGFLGVFGPAQQSLLYLCTRHPMRSLMFLVFPFWALQGLNTKN
jgi:hypothetical protein